MKIAFIVFDNLTMLDLIGFYDPLSRLKLYGYIPNLSWNICSYKNEIVSDSFGLNIRADKVESSLNGYDAVFISGGLGTRELIYNKNFLSWIKTIDSNALKLSVCTGSLILGAAGFLKDKKATTHFKEYELLRNYCKEVVEENIVEDGNVITAGAVAASIDLGLYVCKKLAGANAEDDIRRRMNYKINN